MPSSMQGTVAMGVPTVDEAKRLATLLGLLRVTTSEEQAGTAGASEDKLEWLRSQLIGKNIEFDTPFGRRMLTYADQTASGRSLRYIEDYLVKDVLPFYGNTHTEDSHVGSKTTRLVHKAARYIKRCMSAGPNDVLIFCGSGTTAAIKRLQEVIGVAAPSVELRGRLSTQLRTEERWVIFVGPYEHHSNLLSWRQSLADVVEIRVNADGLIDIAALERALSSPEYKNRPMLGSFSACSNVTGIMTDTREIARVLHQHGAYACFDFAARIQYTMMILKSERMLAPPPIVQKIRTSLAFWVKEYIGYDRMGLHERVYSETAMKRLVSNPNIWVLGNTNVERLPIFSFLIYPPVKDSLYNIVDQPSSDRWLEDVRRKRQPLHGRFVTRLFNDLFGIQARGGCACAGPYGHTLLKIENDLSLRLRSAILQGYSGLKPGWTRLSFSYYLSKEEFKFILSAIEFIASYGHRFLPLYEFDWITGNWTFKKEAIKYLLMKEELALATGLDHLTENDLFKDEAKIEKKPRAIQDKFESYLEECKDNCTLLARYQATDC
ncbi:hypothetical protein PR202_ga03809 [Eleusine coracana subsp. coracana]|uniref:Aminotransferase class V domain-containing protein n=1 Tax=Eleusine coracana subsp. coracana TaxID=191504 RepID=A0AAV5BNQ3_ELECO|nr:hypothetical protein PR202_ga03809 [Eleusine coracana subsp. coracana]